MRTAFNMFDRSKTGTINAKDLKEVLGGGDNSHLDKKIDEIIQEVDTHQTGEIDFDEFRTMMKSGSF